MIEMKPCPFCGGEAKLEPAVLSARFHVDCQNCECGTYARESKAEAIAAWQSRQNISDVLIEALEVIAANPNNMKHKQPFLGIVENALRQAKGGEG